MKTSEPERGHSKSDGPKGIEQTIVDFDGHDTVIVIDHDAKRMNAWSWVGNAWQEVDVVEATHNGNVLYGKKLSDFPTLLPDKQ